MVDRFASISKFQNPELRILLTDIDDTLTDDGLLGAEAYAALWLLAEHGITAVPVTGRPAGWCELIARQWPVGGVVGENGGFYFRYDRTTKKMIRHFATDEASRGTERQRLEAIKKEILEHIPGCAVASDQFCRLLDLAIDYCEDVPALPRSAAEKIQKIFEAHGAQAKVSSIHVNGWFGSYDKLSGSLHFLRTEMGMRDSAILEHCGFVGDSLNDEPMWKFFRHSFAVANVRTFADRLKHPPKFVTVDRGGKGFAELARHLIDIVRSGPAGSP
ncbi:MAG: HAD family hydrolase [Bdellovibrio sp.]|nr:MAG: HAD family hydrolase [Bdellovibrio sp.]